MPIAAIQVMADMLLQSPTGSAAAELVFEDTSPRAASGLLSIETLVIRGGLITIEGYGYLHGVKRNVAL